MDNIISKIKLDNCIFVDGKHKGKTYKDVRINHTEYLLFLIAQL